MDAWTAASAKATPLIAVDRDSWPALLDAADERTKQWLGDNAFAADPGRVLAIPDANGHLERIVVGIDRREPVWSLASLPYRLPAGDYALSSTQLDLDRAALGWALGAYQYTRFRKPSRAPARLVVDADTQARVAPMAEAIALTRDLINAPTEVLGPAELVDAVRELADEHADATVGEWVGEELLAGNFPTIHAVGRASHREPRLAELRHGAAERPHLVIIGKGVCFDTGGLDLKTSDGMRWMKKDMGGAAHAIALARLVLDAELPVRLTLLIPAVENAIGGNAYRPGEVIRTRAGITVEIDNTDAEGRLILCDAIAYAAEQKPDLILDFATLTGAARVALGPDLPALFTNRDELAAGLLEAAHDVQDPLWRMPLWRPYGTYLDSSIADMANAGSTRHAGAVTAALFLERFVPEAQPWCHLDVYSWNDSDRPGRPRGGEAQGLRAYFEFLRRRYSKG